MKVLWFGFLIMLFLFILKFFFFFEFFKLRFNCKKKGMYWKVIIEVVNVVRYVVLEIREFLI